MHETCFSNSCEFQLISEGVASASAVYTCLERETKVKNTFVSRSFFVIFVFSDPSHGLFIQLNIGS
ncbi:hypothetical protein DQ182_02305 [Enterococcus faecium]|nr:hypothetical protein [Enterococcus faecium]EGP5710904.1 hypothetical protein [Enterococcus faecium]EGP5720199.1 hypothetical protein [Enterococcus faecium]